MNSQLSSSTQFSRSPKASYWGARLWTSAFVLMIVIFVAYQSVTVTFFGQDYDEGVYLAQAQLVQAGYVLYEEVKSPLPPLFTWAIVALFSVSPSVWLVRMMIVLWAVGGLLGCAWIGAQFAQDSTREKSAFLAAMLLLVLPLWIIYSQLAMPDIPSLSLSTIAVAVALKGWKGGRSWFFWGGVIGGVALAVKQSTAYVAPVLALVVLLSYRHERPWSFLRFLLDGIATLVGYFLPLILILPFISRQAAYDVMFLFPWEAGRRLFNPLASLKMVALFAGIHLGWLLLALLGVIFLIRRKAWREVILLLGWIALIIIMLSQHAPVWGHLLLPLAPPLVVLAALCISDGYLLLRDLRDVNPRTKIRQAIPLMAAISFFLFFWPYTLIGDRGLAGFNIPSQDQPSLSNEEVVAWLQKNVPSNEWLLTDDLMMAVYAKRLVIPEMSDTSFTKIQADFLTTQDLIEATKRYRPAAIIFWTDRFNRLPEWRQWALENYEVGIQGSPSHIVFIRPDLAK